jgi:hypothetical protein
MGVSLSRVEPISGFFEAGVITMILGVSQLCTRWLF